MNREFAKPWIQKLFTAFGKYNPKDNVAAVYLDWAEKYPEDVVRKAIEVVIREEMKLPPAAVLYKIAKKATSGMGRRYCPEEECYYCGGTGLVPVLYRPNKRSTIPYTRNFACKCSMGAGMRWLPKYFERFEEPQFLARIPDFPGFNYPQVVDQVKREFMKGMNVRCGMKKPVRKDKQNGRGENVVGDVDVTCLGFGQSEWR